MWHRTQRLQAVLTFSGLAICACAAVGEDGSSITLGLPVDCALNETCFVQQYPDMDPANGKVMDPWCGGATYDDHDGTDVRVRSLVDMEAGVPVIAAASGTVLRVRDGEPDRLVRTPQDRSAVSGRECGNGLVIEHGDGLQTQYCHLRNGSIIVRPGQEVAGGDTLGMIGASGLAQFPHVHLTVRRNGEEIDPTSGRSIAAGSCSISPGTDFEPLWDAAVAPQIGVVGAQLLDMGFAAGPVEHESLVREGAPPPPTRTSSAIVGWAWMINLNKGDQIRLRLDGPDGATLAENTTEPMDRHKATYSVFVGKRRTVVPGSYSLTAWLVRDGEEYEQDIRSMVID
jgi:murein DD-endopeptidase MepM/ murein hydrolase activator NlpD